MTTQNSEPYYIEDCEKVQLNSKGWSLQGFSKAGARTGFILYPHKFVFDCGVKTKSCYEHIFMTHVHTDHSLELPFICNRNKMQKVNNKYKVFAPASSTKHLVLLMRCVTLLSYPEAEIYTDDKVMDHQKIMLKGVNSSDIIKINDCEIEVLESHHTIQAVGYGISSIKTKLKPEYQTMMLDETIDKKERINRLNNLKKSGVETNEVVKIPELVFFCDSSIDNLLLHDEWKHYPVVVCECTGLIQNKKTVQDYIEMGHTCILQLEPIMEANKDKKWILIHVSPASTRDEIKQVESDLILKGIDVFIFK